jgi:ubiquinone/menaquinone biosynthesis C-methylase UbiE
MNPPGYIDVQYGVNAAHLNGRQEAEFEEANYHARRFTNWLKERHLPAESFLDAGCRTGYAMEKLASIYPAARIVGVDIVPQFIKVADLRGEAVVGDLQDLPFENDEFDWTFSCTSIEHCPDLKAAISEMQRVSKYGFYVHTDLENEVAFNKNPSHFSYHENPSDWVTDFNAPGWWLTYLNVPRFNRVEMIWVKREHVRKYLIKDDIC